MSKDLLENDLASGTFKRSDVPPFPHTTEWHPIHPLAVPDVMADVLNCENDIDDTEVPPAL